MLRIANPGRRSSRRRVHLAGVTVLTTALVTLIAGCSSSGSATRSNSTSVPSLTVALYGNLTEFLQPIVAAGANLYAKEGLSVHTLYNVGTTLNSLLISGKADIVMYTAPNDLIIAAKGVDSVIVAGTLNNHGSSLIGAPKVKTLADAKGLSGCRLATLTPGSTTYANAVDLVKRLNLHCTIAALTSPALAVAAVQSGNDQLGVVGPSTANTAAQTKKGVHLLLDPLSPEAKPYLPEPTLVTTLSGLGPNLKSKRASVVRFLRAINAANQLCAKDTPAQLAAIVAKTPAFAAVPVATIAENVKASKPELRDTGANPNYISKSFWEESVQSYAHWGISGYNPQSSKNAYEARVDMSYNQAALPGATK